MLASRALAEACEQLTRADIQTPALDARLLVQHALGVSAEWLVAHGSEPLNASQLSRIHTNIARRMAHEPIAYIIGTQDFWKDRFLVTPDTLIPRADSETLIEAALRIFSNKQASLHILDLGTGSGCLLLSLLREFENAHGVGLDASESALRVARRNADALGLSNRAQFVLGDMRDAATIPSIPEYFDIVVSNPPYIRTADIAGLARGVKDYEPHLALDGDADGLIFYRALFKWLPKRLHASSVCLFEVGHDQAHDVGALAEQAQIGCTQTFQDLAGIARVVCVQNV